MKQLNLNLRITGGGIFHDSRADSRLLMQCINKIVQKLNEVVDENNNLKTEIEKLKKYVNN